MDVFVSNNVKVSGVLIPPSKSYAQRAILAAAFSEPTTTIHNTGLSEDVFAMGGAVQKLGAAVVYMSDHFIITGKKRAPEPIIDCGESGLTTRLLACAAPTFGNKFEIKGRGTLVNRSMTDLEEFLPDFGVSCRTLDGHLPLKLHGRLKGGHATIDGSKSSQYLSGLLMALPVCKEDSVIEVRHLASTPYIDVTLDVLKKFNIRVVNENYERFIIEGDQTYRLLDDPFIVEGDYSAAASWLVMGAISGNEIGIKGLARESVQADRAILPLLEKAGAQLKWKTNGLFISKGKLEAFEFNATHCPDLFPVLVVLAAACNGISKIEGVSRLKNKETDRGMVLQQEFGKLGLKIDLVGDFMIINGIGTLDPGTIDSHHDHRVAMAGAIAACLTDKGITVLNAEAVNKSYPEFWKVLGAVK